MSEVMGSDRQPDWAAVGHAYGPAVDVPALLSRLAANGDDWDDALGELSNLINHQGSVYPAAAVAVPFLVRILDGVAPDRRPKLLRLIRFLGVEQRYDYLASMFRFVDESGTEELEIDEAARESRRVIASHLSVILEWLNHADVATVLEAAGVVELSGSGREQILNFVGPALATVESGPVRAALIYLELTSIEPATRLDRALTRVQTESSPEARAVARLAVHTDRSKPWTDNDAKLLVAELCAMTPLERGPFGSRLGPEGICSYRASGFDDQVLLCHTMLRATCVRVQEGAIQAVVALHRSWRRAGGQLAGDVASLLQADEESVRFEAAHVLCSIDDLDESASRSLVDAFRSDVSNDVRIMAGIAVARRQLDDESVGELFGLAEAKAKANAKANLLVDRWFPWLQEELLLLVGPLGTAVIPELIDAFAEALLVYKSESEHSPLTRHSRVPGLIAAALARFGTNAAAAYGVLVDATAAGFARAAALDALASLGPLAQNAIPAIERSCPTYEADLYTARVTDATPATPAVRQALREDRGYRHAPRIGEFGHRAQALAPLLEERLRDAPPLYHAELATAILEVGAASDIAVATLIDELSQFPARQWMRRDWPRMIRALSRSGHPPDSMRDALDEWAHSDRRVLPSPGADNRLRTAAVDALAE